MKFHSTFFYNTRILVYFSIFILFFIVHFLGIMIHNKGLMWEDTITSEAIVRQIDLKNHASVYYEYVYKNKVFSGVDSSELYQTGDKVKIILSKHFPQNSVLAENISTISESLVFSLIGSTFVSLIGGSIILFQFKHSRK